MAGICTKINRGNVDLFLSRLGVNCAEPPRPVSLPTIGTAAVRSTSAASLTVTGMPAGTDLPTGSYFNITTPTGIEVIVQTTAALSGAATTIPVTNVPLALPVGSTIQFPLRLTSRTGANFSRQGNLITVPTFESGGDDEGKVVSRSTSLEAPGVQSVLSAAYQTILNLPVGEYLYAWLVEKPPDPNYSAGQIIKGFVTVVNDGINYNPQDATRNDLTLQFSGPPVIVAPVLV